MKINETSGYKNTKRKIKKNYEANDKLNKILTHISNVNSFEMLVNHVISKIYGFEVLKEDLTGYYRFSLDKNSNSGKYRLLFSYSESDNSITLEYISDNHYEDFKKYLRG